MKLLKMVFICSALGLIFMVNSCSSSGGVSLAPGEKMVTFIYAVPKSEQVREVYVAGDFNDWEAKQDQMTYDTAKKQWVYEMGLMPGEYAYKFVVNGTKWVKPPKSVKYKNDGYGGKNAVMVVK